MLLGIIHNPDSTASRMLTGLGQSLDDIRRMLIRETRPLDPDRVYGSSLSPRLKRVIDLAYDESKNLNDDYLGTQHLLLGLIRAGDCAASRVLHGIGIDLESARKSVILGRSGSSDPPKQAGI
jgi:ATP-dependent Clp protease ATP-binding subunit ClpC